MRSKKRKYKKDQQAQLLMLRGSRDGNDIWLNYIDLNGNMTERVIKPIVVEDERVHAFCYEKRSGRQFLYENIHSARVVQGNPYREAVGRCSCGINTVWSLPHWTGLKNANASCECGKVLRLKWCKERG